MHHQILKRILKSSALESNSHPAEVAKWVDFLDKVNQVLVEADDLRGLSDRALSALTEEMKDLSANQGWLVETMNQEVRNPIALAISSAESLLSSVTDAEQKAALESVIKRCKLAVQQVNQLLCQNDSNALDSATPEQSATPVTPEVAPAVAAEPTSVDPLSLLGLELDDDSMNQETELLADGSKKTILCVDSYQGFRRHMKTLLESKFNVFIAADAAKALELLGRIRMDLVLSEFNLPRESGLVLMKKMRQDPKLSSIPFVFLSTQSNEAARVEALEAGAEEYMTKPFSERELSAKLAMIISVRDHQLKLAKELQIAGKMQQSLLPPPLQNFGDVQLSTFYYPHEDLSGDFYDTRQSGNWLYFYLADVTGHGLVAGQVTLLLKELFHAALEQEPEKGLVDLLKWIAEKYTNYRLEKDLAIQVARYHLKERRVEYFRANAPAAVKVQTDGLVRPTNVKAGPALSTGSAHLFDSKKLQVYVETLKPGESIYLFTDGAYELQGMEKLFGRRQFIEILSKAPDEGWQQHILNTLTSVNGSSHFSDDITVLRLDVLEYKKALISATDQKQAEEIKKGVEAKHPEFKVAVASEVAQAVELLDSKPLDAVILYGVHAEELPMERRFATILITNLKNVSMEKALAGRVDLILSEPFEIGDLVQAVKDPSTQREKQWRRLLERVDVKVRLNVELSEVGEIRQGEVVNIGLGGMFVGISFPMPSVGEQISFKLSFNGPEGLPSTIEGIGLVRWTRTHASESLPVGCGVQFVALTDTSIQNLRHVLTVSKATEMIPLC